MATIAKGNTLEKYFDYDTTITITPASGGSVRFGCSSPVGATRPADRVIYSATSIAIPGGSTVFAQAVGGDADYQTALGDESRAELRSSGVSVDASNYVIGASFGLVPDTGVDLTDKLQAALTAARVAGKPVLLIPGKYIWSAKITNAGGGLVCTGGFAWLDAQDASYDSHVITFQSTDSSYLDGIQIQGIKFTCSTRPDSGLTNDASEFAGFVLITKARNVKVWGNIFEHNYGGCVLFRDVEDSSIIGNEVTDVWKDAFHICDSSRNVCRAFNIVRGCGDDAFPVVGYVAKGTMPIGVTDIGNRVYGCRSGRAFAYVGCKDINNIGCYVDGRIPSIIPQQSSATIAKYGSACALYVGAEAGFNTYGCENVAVSGFTAEYIGPSIDLAGNPVSGIGSYQQIHIAASNGAGSPHKNIKIGATVRNGTSRALFVVGNGYTQDVEADIICDDNTDPYGILSLTSTPGTGNQHAAEFQNVRNIKLKLRANKIAKGAVWIDNACTGIVDLDLSVGSLSQTTAAQSVVTFASTSSVDRADVKINFETVPAASGVGSINRHIDNSGNNGNIRSVMITGVNNATAAGNGLNGWPARTLTPGTSPTTFLNTDGRPKLLLVRGGTVSAIGRAGVRGRVVAKVVVTGASGTVQADGDWTDIYTASTVVTLFNARGVAFATGTVASSALSGGVTTVTFDATGVNASFAVGMQMGVVNTMRTIPSRTNGYIDLPAENVIQVTYSVTPTIQITDVAY